MRSIFGRVRVTQRLRRRIGRGDERRGRDERQASCSPGFNAALQDEGRHAPAAQIGRGEPADVVAVNAVDDDRAGRAALGFPMPDIEVASPEGSGKAAACPFKKGGPPHIYDSETASENEQPKSFVGSYR